MMTCSLRRVAVTASLATGLALLVGAADALGASCSPSTFVRASSFPAGSYPNQVITADLNGDGVPDAVTADGNNGTGISILLGVGDGTFAAPQIVTTSYGVYAIAVADFNGDQVPDLAVGEIFSVAILIGNGDGTFQAPVTYAAGTFPSGLSVGDFDGDGNLDVVEGDSSNGFYVFYGHGNGSFNDAVLTPTTAQPLSLAVGNFDGDTRDDIVVSMSYSTSIFVYPGRADRTFGPPIELQVDNPVGPVIVGDFNGDTKLDIAVAANIYVAVLLGNGDGTFQAGLESFVGQAPLRLVAGDLDLDGNLDVIATRGDQSGTALALLGDGTGLLTLTRGYETGPNASSVALADLNGDGLADIVSADSGAQTVSVLLGEGLGRFRGIEVVPSLPSGRNLATGDFNGDGIPDMAVLGVSDGTLLMLLGDGSGGFRPAGQTPIGYGAYWVAAGDFNEDGHLDVAVTMSYGNSVVLLMGNGAGGFEPATGVTVPFYGRQIAAADFNADGHTDLAINETDFAGPDAIAILLGNGDGTFQPPIEQPLGEFPVGLTVADLNGDGYPDVAVPNQSNSPGLNTISVLLGHGDGSLSTPADYASGPYPVSIAAGDFNGDGKVDLVVADSGADNVSLLFGNGNGSFAAPVLVAIGWSPAFVVAADFNGDGKLDFATANGGQSNVSVLLGLGTGGFQSPVSYLTGSNAAFLAAADLVGSGTIDLAVINSGDTTISVLHNSAAAGSVAGRQVLVGSPAALTVSASGYGALTYQWRKNGMPLSDGGAVSGATTATLTIDPAAFTDAASYDVLVTDSCGTITSSAGTLSVEFADVPTSSIFHADILTIATAGITAGCGGADYCPSALVSRAQMAVFLLKSEHGSAYVPPACAGLFTDVPCPSTYANWIEQLANEGVTAGCGNGNYCPDASITRAQMAIFLLKTSQGSAYVPPAATAIFDDVPVDAFGAAFIDDLYTRGIAGGCSASPLLYCPNNVVNRAQMAAFLVNTFF